MTSLDHGHGWPQRVPNSTRASAATAHLRVGEADREQASARLAEHYASGRLAIEEYYERLDAVWSARVHGDLEMLFLDLPHSDLPAASPAPATRPPRRVLPRAAWWLILAATLMLLGVPWWVLVAVAVGLLVLHGRRSHRRATTPRRRPHRRRSWQ